ncbi:penicillin-binding protein [Marinilongibacter aquaticus]|uniref:penicillin-binding protein 1A n=1 Tax=Marinilongibacter aquaticus TaxID=2975157 RepID=UPI0021BD1711|nr:transglycosylase domain-containing protein [Marinilongibacter aquaticus]UBM57967.1 penicillin-binding protein [Marinilongibacter aquaticus]
MKFPQMKFLAKGKHSKLINFLYVSFFGGIGLFIVYLVAVNFNLFWLFGKIPGIDDLDNPKSEIASEIISSDGKVLGKFFYEFANRSPVDFEEISPKVIDALISTEDVRFTKHSGIDARSMLRVIGGLVTLDPKGGGSTITQQLAKNLFRLRNDDSYESFLYHIPVVRTLIIKTKEWIMAVKLEKRYTKQEIMKMYLDTIEFSSGAHGIKSAAKTYFKKSPKDLTTNEAALLVGMIQNPSRFNPKFRPQYAKPRRNTVLAQMVKYGKLSKDEFDQLKEEDIVLNYSPDSHNNGPAPYFRQFLKDWAKQEITKHGYKPEDIYTKGFRIYTTIDSRMQKYAEQAMEEHMEKEQELFNEHWKGRVPWVQRKYANSSSAYVPIPNFIEDIAKYTPRFKALKKKFNGDEKKAFAEMEKKTEMSVFTWQGEKDTLMSPMDSIRHYKRFLNMGLLAMDPRNGQIKAWVGGINYRYFKYDHVEQTKRQPGSTFKPFVYVTAIDNGFSTCEEVVDEPITFGPEDGLVGKTYTPKNSTGKYTYRSMTLRDALGESVNSVSARLIKQFKPQNVVNMAHQLGIKSELPATPSLCLGVGEVSLYELLSGYAVFANGGKYTDPLFVTRIEDKHGELVQEYFPNQKEVLSAETAYKMIHLMRGSTMPGGTSAGLYRYGVLDNNDVAGKTGTTSNYSDGWFMGLTQNLIAGVWCGADNRSIHFRSIHYGQGARMALPAWGLFMQKVYADKEIGLEKTKFNMPPGIRVAGDCILSPGEIYTPQSDSLPQYAPSVTIPEDEDDLL